MELIDEILMDLVPYMDRVFICPADDLEIKKIEEVYGRNLPKYYRYFLSRVGIRQDFIRGLHATRSRYKDISDFISSRDYFQIGNNGGDDYWLLKFDDENNRTIYEYDYYCNGEILSTTKSFDSIIIDAFEDVKLNYDKKAKNTEKVWCVEFSINTGSPSFLVKELGKDLEVKLLKEPKKILKDGEIEFENGLLEIEGKEVELKKWVYSNPSLSFNWKEPVLEMREESVIKKIDLALENCLFSHKLVQYGILKNKEIK